MPCNLCPCAAARKTAARHWPPVQHHTTQPEKRQQQRRDTQSENPFGKLVQRSRQAYKGRIGRKLHGLNRRAIRLQLICWEIFVFLLVTNLTN
tara:strand:+ start:1423 stop:1701 length:279 start_codon:yes stop_codon:yes gene_type:complete